jgi:hypothetical protein
MALAFCDCAVEVESQDSMKHIQATSTHLRMEEDPLNMMSRYLRERQYLDKDFETAAIEEDSYRVQN